MASIQIDIDTSINIYRRRENILYNELYDADNVGVAYVKVGEEVLASENVSILDRSDTLINNKIQVIEPIVVENSSSYIFETDQIIITDQILTLTDNLKVPLFWQHIIDTDNVPRVSSSDYTLASGTILSDIQILDRDFSRVEIQQKNIDYSKGLIYSNLQNNIDDEIYYIQYTVKSGSDIQTYTEILNNEKIYSIATFDDLDEDLNIINDGRKVYIPNKLEESFQIILPDARDYGFQILPRAKIKILPFDNLDLTFPWFPRISNGNFFIRRDGRQYQYYIAQFDSQSWNPEFPYKKIEEEPSTYINIHLIQLNRDKIQNDPSESMYLDVLINNQNDIGLVAFTTDPSLHDTIASNGAKYYYYSFSSKIGMRSVDYLNGLVDIEGYDLDPSYKIYATYYSEEEDFEFDTIDLNPFNNKDIVDQRLVLFVDPDESDTTSEKTLYYFLVNKDTNKVISSDWDSFDNAAQKTISGKDLFYRGIPDSVSSSSYEIFSDVYAVEGSGDYFILGDLTVGLSARIQNLETRDIRVPGGGLIEDRISDAKKENPEVIWYWDIGKWDGESYPGNASYYIEVPVSVFSGAGGTFTQKQGRDIIERHTALGVYPVIKAYGVDPYITDAEPSTDSIYIEWYSYGSDKLYNVYYSVKPNGPWTKSNSSLISDIYTGNFYTINGLTSGVYYYIMIVGGILSDTTFLPQCGQAIGPVEDGIQDTYNINIAKVKTR